MKYVSKRFVTGTGRLNMAAAAGGVGNTVTHLLFAADSLKQRRVLVRGLALLQPLHGMHACYNMSTVTPARQRFGNIRRAFGDDMVLTVMIHGRGAGHRSVEERTSAMDPTAEQLEGGTGGRLSWLLMGLKMATMLV